jgi:hypothetical protein
MKHPADYHFWYDTLCYDALKLPEPDSAAMVHVVFVACSHNIEATTGTARCFQIAIILNVIDRLRSPRSLSLSLGQPHRLENCHTAFRIRSSQERDRSKQCCLVTCEHSGRCHRCEQGRLHLRIKTGEIMAWSRRSKR